MIDGDRVVVDDIFNNDGVSSSLHLSMLISTKSKCVHHGGIMANSEGIMADSGGIMAASWRHHGEQ